MGCPLWDWAACAPHATAIVNRTAPANAWMGISWSSGTTEQPQEAQRQPGYVGDEEHSGAENAGHRQGRARHFEHGLVEPIGREQDVQTHERRQIPELEVCDEDDSEENLSAGIRFAEAATGTLTDAYGQPYYQPGGHHEMPKGIYEKVGPAS